MRLVLTLSDHTSACALLVSVTMEGRRVWISTSVLLEGRSARPMQTVPTRREIIPARVAPASLPMETIAQEVCVLYHVFSIKMDMFLFVYVSCFDDTYYYLHTYHIGNDTPTIECPTNVMIT